MDPLEDVLTLLDTRSHLSSSLVAGGRWAIRFDAPSDVKFNAVRRGHCLIEVEGMGDPLALEEGDCYLLTQPRRFTLRSDPQAVAVDADRVFASPVGGVARTGDGEDDVLLVGGRFSFSDRAHTLLLEGLPPLIHIPAGTPQAETLQWALAHIDRELRDGLMGSILVAEHLAVVMLVHVLRLHLARDPEAVSGWLAGLGDPVVAAALTSLHSRPEHPWTVAELAQACAVSRSTLAARFKTTVGRGPLDYLNRWRVELASRHLRQGTDTVSAIARTVGYGSESALSTAFKRINGMSPRDYRKTTQAS
ncbi:AraC family transcriptional regulator [Streptomyces sp. NPDC007875]|uniref:AraC family transcriptional regulator n=2 Tax=unclassified Streptomyces TaxID=2593676 RepID=UPI0036CD1DE3